MEESGWASWGSETVDHSNFLLSLLWAEILFLTFAQDRWGKGLRMLQGYWLVVDHSWGPRGPTVIEVLWLLTSPISYIPPTSQWSSQASQYPAHHPVVAVDLRPRHLDGAPPSVGERPGVRCQDCEDSLHSIELN